MLKFPGKLVYLPITGHLHIQLACKADQLTEQIHFSLHHLIAELFDSADDQPKVDVIDTNEIDPYSLIGFDKVLMTKAAVEKIEAWLS